MGLLPAQQGKGTCLSKTWDAACLEVTNLEPRGSRVSSPCSSGPKGFASVRETSPELSGISSPCCKAGQAPQLSSALRQRVLGCSIPRQLTAIKSHPRLCPVSSPSSAQPPGTAAACPTSRIGAGAPGSRTEGAAGSEERATPPSRQRVPAAGAGARWPGWQSLRPDTG